MSEPVIKVSGLGKQYHIGGVKKPGRTLVETLSDTFRSPFRRSDADPATSFWALKDVNFEINRGEVVGIIGRNGAGKSTLLKILSRITDPTEGEIDITGRVGSLLEVGTGFHPELTGRENVYLNGAILGMRKADIAKKFDEIVAFAETEKFLDTPVKYYSSGMYTRLAFAVAAHLEPEILIVDEVLAVGDAEFQKKCLGKMRDVAGHGRTVIFVSHNMNAVEQLCDSILALDRGKVGARGNNVRRLIEDYLHIGGAATPSWENTADEFANPYFRPTRFYLADSVGNPIPSLQSNVSDIHVNIEAEIEKVDPALTVGYAIYSENGICLYWSYQTDAAPAKWPKLKTGRCKISSQVPKRFLNEGHYRIELIGGLTNRQWLFEPQLSAPHITLQIQGGISDSPLYTTPRKTAMAPILDWIDYA